MIVKCKDVKRIAMEKFCSYYKNNCFQCVYRLTDKHGLWCRIEGKYVYEYKNEEIKDNSV